MELAEEYTRNELDVKIHYDMDPESPREWSNVGKMFCSHRSYNLGDEQFNPNDFDGWDDVKLYLKEVEDAVIILPLGLYDHGSITMYVGDTHDRWDGGQVGFIYCTQADIDREWNGSIKDAEQYLIGEVKTYDTYLRGDVYGITITNPRNGDEIENCWGFYGLDYAKEEANSIADAFVHPHDAAYAKNARILHG